MPNNSYACPVCGYPGLDEPPVDSYGCPSFAICPCCGTEFGYEDATLSHERLRQKWLANGAKWFSSTTAPPMGWSALTQLRKAGFAVDFN